MMPAAKHYDPILGVDIHIIQPPGPVPPVPIPHPFVGFLIDPFDYVPILGATVMINGIPRAIAGTAGKCVPPHIPIGGTFIKPPGNECEMFMGSSTVTVDGDAMSYMALPALSCQCVGMPPPPRPKKKSKTKSLVLPTSVVLPIPAGPPVLIGGPPTISMMAIGMKLGMAGLGRGLRRLARSGLARRAGAAFRRLRQRLFRNMRPGTFKCRILRAEPVDIITGEVVVDQQDFSIPGRIPIEWNRHYGSHSDRPGVCGYGWETPADARLVLEEDGSVTFYDGTPGATLFPSLPDEGPVAELVDGAVLDQTGDSLMVRTKAGRVYCFPKPETGVTEILVDRVKDLCGNYLQFIRDENGLKAIQESAGRRIEVISRNGLVRQMHLYHPDYPDPHPLVRYEYNEWGDLVTVYDALDAPYRFRYDDHRLVQHTDRNGLSFYYEYDSSAPDWRCVHSWGDGGLYNYHFEFDDLLSETRITDSLGHVWTVQFDERQLPVQEIDPLGGVTQFEYDEVGRTTAVVDPAGHRTEYEYDDNGKLINLTRPDGSSITTTYDSNGLPISLVDPNGNPWSYAWDERQLLREHTNPCGARSIHHYDRAGDLTAVIDPLDAATRYQRDPFGNLVAIIDALGHAKHFECDAMGRATAYLDPMGNKTEYCYDPKGRLIEVRYPSKSRLRYQYDNQDNLTAFRDENAHMTKMRYSGLGELAERVNPDGTRIRYEYDTEERLTAVVNERGQKHTIVRDSLGRILQETDYWGGVQTHRYDAAGNRIGTVDPLGRQTGFEYDALGRITEKTCFDGQKETFGYDARGNLVLAENATISVLREYGKDGTLLEESQGDFKVTSEYDLNGNRVARTSSHGHQFRYSRDVTGNVTDISLNGRHLARIQHDDLGRVSAETLAQSLKRSVSYDLDGRLDHQELRRDGRPVVERRYQYDPSGNLLHRQDSSKGTVAYQYDPMGRVREQQGPVGGVERLVYDPAGDVLREVSPQPGSEQHRLARMADKTVYFDAAGHMVRRRSRDGEARFEWDGADRLVSAVNEKGQAIKFGYDAIGRRSFKEVDGVRTYYQWDGEDLLAEDAGAGHPREFIFRPGTFEPLASVNGRVYYYENDPVGLPHEVVDDAGEIVWSASYGLFGGIIQMRQRTVDNPIRLQGQYYDEETGLSYNRHRYYDPLVGSFISKDPLGLAAGENLYRYAPNVWTWIDPLGLVCVEHAPDFDTARRMAFERAGMTDPSQVTPTRFDPVTGTAVEFRGPGGARVAYDAPHADMDPSLGHDRPHVGWQSGGKRSSGARRGNITYDGPQHPSRPDNKA